MRSLYLFLFLMLLAGCTSLKKSAPMPAAKPDLQGHRGARGLMPENTIPAMFRAIDLGATTLEMDVVISRDKQVVLSHEPYFHEFLTTTPQGNTITASEAASLLLYQMDYDSIRRYDVGLKPHPLFTQQQKMPVYKPLLSELIDSCEAYAARKGKRVGYNIEIKSAPGQDGVRHPAPPEFSDLVLAVVRDKNVLERTTIQSFDVRVLQYLHQQHPKVVLSYLVEQTPEPLETQLQLLGFVPAIYSPYYKDVRKEMVDAAHRKGMRVIPWTINTAAEMQHLLNMGVDGVISDYPNLFAELKY